MDKEKTLADIKELAKLYGELPFIRIDRIEEILNAQPESKCSGCGYEICHCPQSEFDLIANDRIGEIRIKWLKSTKSDGVEEYTAVPQSESEDEQDYCVACGGCGQVDSGEIPKDGVPFLEICPECKGSGSSLVGEDEKVVGDLTESEYDRGYQDGYDCGYNEGLDKRHMD